MWGFHAVALTSGAAEKELAAKREFLNRVRESAELTSWQRSCSYRVVGRAELEEIARADVEAKRREEKVLEEATRAERADEGDVAVAVVAVEKEEEKERAAQVAATPLLLALAFQRLVGQDKQEFLAHQQTAAAVAEEGGEEIQVQTRTEDKDEKKSTDPTQTPARVYLLVDYPSSLLEIDALLRLGEEGCASQVTDGPEKLPLLPLIDGVVLLANPPAISKVRAQNRRGSNVSRFDVNVDGGGSVEVSVFQTANAVVKVFHEAAQVGGIEWSDFTFTNVVCSTESSGTKRAEELENETINTLETIAAQKFAFKDWVASTKFIAIPNAVGDGDDGAGGALYEQYDSVLRGVFSGSVAVSTVLFAITEAVATVSLPPVVSSTSYNITHDNQVGPSQSEEFIEHGDLVACRVAGAQLCHEALNAEGDPCLLQHGSHRLDDVERAMWKRSDLPGVGNEGRKSMPRVPEFSEQERSIRDTELATFYDSPRFSCSAVHLTRQLLQVEEMLETPWRGKLQTRAHLENLTRAVLPQRIALVLQQNTPAVYSSYYAPTDSLLLACLPKTAPGRVHLSSWVARDHVRHRPAFKDWKRQSLVSQEYLTPRTEAASGACVPLSAAQLALVGNKTWSMYPADHSVVRLYQTCRGLAWLTVYHHGEMFGLRPGITTHSGSKEQTPKPSKSESECMLQFIASFQDESTLHISEGRRKLPKKPDKFPTISATNSFPNGLIVCACSDGSIVQRYAETAKESHKISFVSKSGRYNDHEANSSLVLNEPHGLEGSDEGEKYRVIYGTGSVLRMLCCGRKEVMLSSGIVRVVHDCKKHRHGSRKRTSSDSELQPPLVTTLTVDPETDALVERRPNGVVIVTFTSGARVTYHVDGTRMYTNARNTHVLVKKRGFADVCIDLEVNMTAQRHAVGKRVAVTKGGLRARSIVNVYDGTRIEISYNTKVTAQVNGRVTTRKPSGQSIVAKDSGRVEYRSQQLDPSALDSRDDDDRDVTTHNGVYYFDCRRGQFQLCDKEQNQFHVDLNGVDEEPTISVDLAGVVSDTEAARYDVDSIPAKAVINEPIQPHIFILNGDGTGVEVLRPRDIAEYITEAGSKKQMSDLTGTGPLTPRNHVFLRRLSAPGDASRQTMLLFNDPKLHDEMLDLQRPVATAGKHLPNFFIESDHAFPLQQFTTVRRIQHIQPLSTDELKEMQVGWAKWEQWQKDREANMECYKVVDPRQPEVIAQELAMQKKVLAAYKATRARKKMARQKAREMKAKSVAASQEMRMETVEEGEETLTGEDEEEGSDDEFGQFGSDMSNDDIGESVEVDDPMELLWSAFSHADTEGRGWLSIAQTRLGVVEAVGIGVTIVELTEALVRLQVSYPFNVSFGVFADLVAFFRKGDDNDNQEGPEVSDARGPASRIPSLKGMAPEQRNGLSTPRAADAIRARHAV